MNSRLWRHEGGKVLMRAMGFGEPLDSIQEVVKGQKSEIKSYNSITLQALPRDISKILKLPSELIQSIKSKRYEIDQEIIAMEGAPSVSAAIREMRVFHTLTDVRVGVETALTIVRNILADPRDMKMYRVKRSNPTFQKSLGLLKNSELLMHAIGFLGGSGNKDLNNTNNANKSYNNSNNDDEYNNDKYSAGFTGVYILKSLSKGGFDPTISLTQGIGKR